MKKTLRITLISIVAFLVIIQFVPKKLPENTLNSAQDLLAVEQVPGNIREILTRACYDCHSYQTVYPWYAYVAPVSWLVAKDIREGRKKLNLSEWGIMKKRSRIKVLSEMADEVDSEEMPMPIYLIMHQDAKLNANERQDLIKWTDQMAEQIMEGG